MIAVFKTNVSTITKAKSIIRMLKIQFSGCKPNFDLEDCDKVLRVENKAEDIITGVVRLLNENGFECVELED
jgi:hypothetical protein